MSLPVLTSRMLLKPSTDRTVPSMLQQIWQLLVWPVWNHNQRRLRSPLRAVLPLVVTFLALALIQQGIRQRFDHLGIVGTLETIGLLCVLSGAVLLSASVIDRRPIPEYGLSFDYAWLRSFAVGGAIATTVNAGTLLVALGAGWVTVVDMIAGAGPLPFLPAMGMVFGYITVAAAWEEFIFRAGMLQNLAEGANGYVPHWAAISLAVFLSSGIFAFLHSGKLTHPTQLGYYLIAGLILGIVYVLSGDLALPIGFHAFYNFTMAAIFGLGTSQQTPELLVLDVVGPAFWIGEEGLAQVVFVVIGGVLLVAYIRLRDGHLRLGTHTTQWTPRPSYEEGDK